MKTGPICLVVTFIAGGAFGAAFENLGFDNANTNGIVAGGTAGPTADLLPGWSLSSALFGPISSISYNSSPPGNGWVALLPKDNFGLNPPYPVFGLYSLAVDPGDLPAPNSITLSQGGDVPADTRTINFLTYGSGFELRLNGTQIL